MRYRFSTFLKGARAAGFGLAAAALLPAAQASAAMGDWERGEAQVRLVANGVDEDGRLNAGIEIALAPGWKTYWRSPGDAGVAPLIDFSASTNVGELDVAFPVPHRFDDGYSVTNVYENRVVFPVTGLVEDLNQPVELALDLVIGVCREICIPDQFETRLSIPIGDDDTVAGNILTEARRLLPGPAEPGIFEVENVSRDGGTDRRPVFVIDAMMPETAAAEVFVEGPPDWSPRVPELVGKHDGYATYRVQFSRLGAKTPLDGATFRVTMVSNGQAVEDTVSLD